MRGGRAFQKAGLAALIALLLWGAAPPLPAGGTLTVLTYNTENLFDARQDGGEYADYRPGRWSEADYRAKLACVAAAVAASCRGGPDIVALQELENRRVLEDLQAALRRLGYEWAATVPPGSGPVGVAFLSRIPILRTRTHLLSLPEEPPLRPILEIEVEAGGEPLILFNNHWKSKTEGLAETEPARLRAAAVLRGRLRALAAERPGAAVVVLGDFNENVEEFLERGAAAPTALIPLASRPPPELAAESLLLVPPPVAGSFPPAAVLAEPWYELARGGWGSYFFRGLPQTPDHILLAASCFDGCGWEYRPGSFRQVPDPSGKPPRRFAAGGCSDHLPLLLVLERR